MKISLIAAVDRQWGLGKNNQLLCHLPADLKYFKSTTLNKPIIMGYNTYRSIGKALPKRQNIVLSRQVRPKAESIIFAETLAQAFVLCADAAEVMIIGGAMVYQEALPLADKIYLTRIEHQFDADVFFPELELSQWQRVSQDAHPADQKNLYPYTFEIYQKGITNDYHRS